MKAKPILMSGPMVRALIDGRKTQTRRAARSEFQEWFDFLGDNSEEVGIRWGQFSYGDGRLSKPQWLAYSRDYPDEGVIHLDNPYGQPGDLLWVRETWALVGDPSMREVHYRADYEQDSAGWEQPGRLFQGRWTPSIHMPRWASRLTLRITDVRVERLQEISEDDAKSEGIDYLGDAYGYSLYGKYAGMGPTDYIRPVESFGSLWESINGPGSWDENPWVWCLSFSVIQQNVNDVLRELAA